MSTTVTPRRRGRRRQQTLERVLGTPALFATAYGNVGSSIYYALGLVAGIALGLTPLVFLVSGLIFAATAATYAEGTVRYPEAGGSSSFARHAFNELVSFGAAWAQMLNYIITIAISAFFVPHYLSIFWSPLRENPWDIVGGAVVVVLLVLLNIVGIREAARLNIFLAVLDFGTQLLLVGVGFALIFHPHVVFSANLHWGVAPTWGQFFLAIPIAMIAYTGIETVSNLAEEARDPPRDIPRSITWVAGAVFAIYFTLPMIALSALPVEKTAHGYQTLLGVGPDQGGFKNDPVLGLVEHLGLHGQVLQASKIYVGILAATILLIATNAGVIGASRITYAMATHRQLPEVFRRLHPKLKTPWLSLVFFAGLLSILVLLPGQTDFLGNMYAFGAMLSFTIAHLSVIALRFRTRDDPEAFKVRPSLRVRRRGLATVCDLRGARHRRCLARGRRPEAGGALGRAGLARDRAHRLRRVPPRGAAPAADRDVARPGDHRAGGRARIQEHPRAREAGPGLGGGDRPRLPPRRRPRCLDRGPQRGRRAPRPAAGHTARSGGARRRRRPRRRGGDRRALRREVHGADRQGPPRRPGDRRRGEAPSERDHRHGRAARGARGRGVFSDTVDFVLKHAPSRVMVVAGRRAA